MPDEYIEIDVDETVHQTELAVLFHIAGKEVWVPKSCLDDYPEEGESGVAMVAEWWAEREGLI